MATIHLEQPEHFDFKSPDGWPKWKRRFEHFRAASGLSATSAAQQVSTLLYCLGEEADTFCYLLTSQKKEGLVYETVMQTFDEFFQLLRNVIFERTRFNRQNQLEGESSEQYISELYCLVDNCNYGNLKDELLRDRLVVGIRDQELSKKLQLDQDLTLEKTKKTIRQKAVKEQHYILQGNDTKEPSLEEARYGKWHRKPPTPEVRPQYIQRDTNS